MGSGVARSVAVGDYEGYVVAMLPQGVAIEPLARDIQAEGRGRHRRVTIGVGRSGSDLANSGREAVSSVRLGLAATDEAVTINAGDLGPLYFLLDVPDITTVAELGQKVLFPLDSYDASAQVPLLGTLEAVIEANGHYAAAAKRLGIHTSTLKYRVRKIQGVLDMSLADQSSRSQLWLALKVRRLLESLHRDAEIGSFRT